MGSHICNIGQMGDQREPGVEGGGGKPSTPLGSWFGSQKRIYLEQKSRVYTPDYSPANLWKYYFGAAIAFGVLGVALGIHALTVKEVVIDYTECCQPRGPSNSCRCPKNLVDDSDQGDIFPIQGPILIYYYIENFHQNHRGYEDDRDDKQLAGKTIEGADCANNTRNVQPCGYAANTMFTDKVVNIWDASGKSQVKSRQENDPTPMNDPKLKDNLSYSMEKYAYAAPMTSSQPRKPERWTEEMHKKYLKNDPSFMEDFKVWMRLAPLPKFQKLWYRMGEQMDTLDKGTIRIEVNWPSSDVDSSFKIPNLRKKIILTQQSFMGAKSYSKSFISLILAAFFVVCGFILRILAAEDGKYDNKKNGVKEEARKKKLGCF